MSATHGTGAYWKVFFALIVCTIATVGQSRMDEQLGHTANLVIGLTIATFKAFLVAWIFMHLRHEKRYFYPLVLFPLALLLVIIFANMPDTAFGDHLEPGKDVGTAPAKH